MRNILGIKVRIKNVARSKFGELFDKRDSSNDFIESVGILVQKLSEGTPMKILFEDREYSKKYGIFTSSKIERIEYKVKEPWIIETAYNIYEIEEILE